MAAKEQSSSPDHNGGHAADDSGAQMAAEFRAAVNMTAAEIERWLETPQSKEVGQKTGPSAESTGHHSGRRIVEILRKKKAEYTAEDHEQMRRVVSYVHRHLAQGPDGDPTHSRWRYSLMNWGHDPCQDSKDRSHAEK